MLTLKNNTLLTSDSTIIDSHSHIIQLKTDNCNCSYLGLITLKNSTIKTIQFVNIGNNFKGRLNLLQEDLQNLTEVTIKIVSISSDFTIESNSVPLFFDTSKINLNIKQFVSKEIKDLKKSIVSLEDKLATMTNGKIISDINISNKDYIQPGMVPVAITKNTFMAAYPFADIIKTVNGQQAVDGVVEIDASMIKYNTERTIEEQLKILGEVIKIQNQTIQTISSELTTLSKKLADLSVKVETHLDNGVL